MILLDIRGLTKYFGGLAAVCGVDLQLEAGVCQALIGPNGAGKTTLLDLIMGQLRVSRGHIRFQGKEITGLPSHRIARQGIAKTFQKPQLFTHLTTYENVRTALHVGHSPWRHAHSVQRDSWELLQRLGLTKQAAFQAADLSHGEQKRLEIAMALGQRPAFLLLDEPTAGLSRVETDQMVRLISTLTETTLLLVEHDMKVVMALAQTVTVMHQGYILARGRPDEIQANQRVQEVYLRIA